MQIYKNNAQQIDTNQYRDSKSGELVQGLKYYTGKKAAWKKLLGKAVALPINGQIQHVKKRNLKDWLRSKGISNAEIQSARSVADWFPLVRRALNSSNQP